MLLSEANFDLDKFLILDIEDSNIYISAFDGFNVANMELFASYLSDIGLNDNCENPQKYLEKALQLYELCNTKSKTYSLEREANMNKLKNTYRMKLDFNKQGGLIPAVVQDAQTNRVLMVGFMNEEAYEKTVETQKVTFFSRTRHKLWTKGETSGNFLNVVQILIDCDVDTLLIKANPVGPVCHTGADTCFDEKNEDSIIYFNYLQDFIERRQREMPEGSYTTSLFRQGINKMAQKLGEETVETVIEATNGTQEALVREASDLVYHLIVLLTAKGIRLEDLAKELKNRHKE
jgi:phosphoribosyl-ATP pyrophosphohydrolase/phosphoribosyl-AMP cyclohydrolase